MIRPTICFLLLTTVATADNTKADKLSTAANQLQARMFSEVVKDESQKNVAISAFSVMPALAQLAVASVGESRDELLKTIGAADDNEAKSLYSQSKIRPLLESTKDIELRTANKIYISTKFELNEDVEAVSRDTFGSEVNKLDFVNSTMSADEINLRVKTETNSRIKEVIIPESINADTQGLLVNALYFKGAWKYPFIKISTGQRDFFVNKDKVVKVPTMFVKRPFQYVESPELNSQVVELLYVGNMSMIVIVPKNVDGIKELEQKLTDPTVLDNIYLTMNKTQLKLYLPKFKVESTTNLKNTLKNIHVKKLFTPNEAKINNLLQESSGFYISDAVQKVVVEVNETGVGGTSGKLRPTRPSERITLLQADRPFYFAVKRNYVTLFSGVIMTPQM